MYGRFENPNVQGAIVPMGVRRESPTFYDYFVGAIAFIDFAVSAAVERSPSPYQDDAWTVLERNPSPENYRKEVLYFVSAC